ncbi:MAG: helicase-exonuclease AddAB subunit AddA, partial [Clostridiales bacterium]|nr:helicase-exonuclease AddAB subunit AddA [Clostridiales bacterium]
QLEEEDSGFRLKLSGQRSDDLRVPNFISNEEPVKGAQLGSTYHKILDNKSILNLSSKEDLNKYLTSLYNSGSLTLEELESIDKDRLLIFLNSDLAKRMSRASKENCLYTEAQFIIGLKANEINNQLKSDELVLVQGVIDVYFEEDGELVLVDYKTDKVDKRYGEETLRKRYSIQLDYYERALRQLTNKNVKERIIYSFELNKAIEI